MAFFARPDLSDEQFKQLIGSQLTLSGQTRIVTTSGLTLSDGAGGNVIITARDAQTKVGEVLTFDGTEIKLMPSTGGGGGIYYGLSPTTCTVGGLPFNSAISGCTVNDILQQILVPTLVPALSPNYNTFGITPATTVYEIGCQIIIAGNQTYNRGSVSPVYCSGPSTRTGLPSTYLYNAFGSPLTSTSVSLSNSTTFPQYTIQLGNNPVSGQVSYSHGEYAKDSSGANYGACCPAATTIPAKQIVLSGIYPYFWGTLDSAPTAGQGLINTANKVVGDSSDNITISFNVNTPSKYLWFAIPATSTPKTSWIGSNSATNTEPIPSSTFGSPTTATINSPSASPNIWSGQSYKFYISNYPTNTYSGGQYYSITFKNS